MENLGLNEIREKYLSFFESKGHLRLPGFSLVPEGNNSLLLINSGMAPLKPYFTGEITPPRSRVTTCQRCIRTPDIERVGKTARHGTFFEMLGNFSFGDYFKHDAAAWAWEFITKVMEIPAEKLYISVFLDDDEAFGIWTKEIGVDPAHMVRLGREDNFWEIGAGPCGPCSEIYYDRGEKYGCGSETCAVGCDCDRYVEFWNLVFTQFNNDGEGSYTPLAKKNIDTGMGLERLAVIMQGVNNLFEVDTIRNIITRVCELTHVEYGENEKRDVSIRVITDHIRGTVFLVSDGVIPSNEGRGYVLRRLIRRAARHGKLLGIQEDFLTDLSETVIKESGGAYPQLVEKKDYIFKVIDTEEKQFGRTVNAGLNILNNMIAETEAKNGKTLAASDVFKLYDTFGFPVDLTREILEEHGIGFDVSEVDALMQGQKKRAREARLSRSDTGGWDGGDAPDLSAFTTVFKGYETLKTEATLSAMIINGEISERAGAGDKAVFLIDETPFYGESGGQVGDQGIISGLGGALARIDSTAKSADGKTLHHGQVISGAFTLGEKVTAHVDILRRQALMRAHSSTHLLQKALREVLGTHVEQAGSLVEPDRLRFDFSHFSAMTSDEIAKVESLVNGAILSGFDISCREMPIKDAKALGATALFGEKYGNIVRVVKMGDYSIELCGGTHLDNTSKAGLFKILSEASVAAGMRRIEAATGFGVLELFDSVNGRLNETAAILKSTPADITRRARQVMDEIRENERKLDAMNAVTAKAAAAGLMSSATELGPVKVVVSSFSDISVDMLRSIGDMLRDKDPAVVAVLALKSEDKLNFLAICGSDAIKAGAHAGNIIREVAKIANGSGGGRPDSAMAGGKDLSKLGDALRCAPDIIGKFIKR